MEMVMCRADRRSPTWGGLGPIWAAFFALSGCGTAGSLTPMDLDAVEQALGAPSGELEGTDARGLAYTVFNARTILSIMTVAAEALPGIDRSPLFEPESVEGCRSEVPRGFEIDMPCLGYPFGKMRVQAQSELANDNGTYEITLDKAAVEEALIAEGTFLMRVEGIANPVAIEKTSIAPTAVIDGMPRFFETLEGAGIVVDNSRGNEALYYVVAVLSGTYVIQVDEITSTAEALVYTVQDNKNLWSCSSQLSGNQILESECRTPVGQGDFAELKF